VPQQLEIHPAAVEEAGEAYRWYAKHSLAAADQFLAELDRAFEQITRRPDAWSPYLHGTRSYFLKRFPFVVVYRPSADAQQVLAIAHVSRRPGYWNERQAAT
jgi:plasmid stabilization system protein ParE